MLISTIFVLTFNFGLNPPNASKGDVERLLWPDKTMSKPSVFVVGLQGQRDEKGRFEGPAWMREIRNELFTNGYAQVTEEVESNGAIMAVFCGYKRLPTVDLSSVKSGTGELSKEDKSSGATAVSLKIAGKSFCFINTYMPFTQHQSIDLKGRRNRLVKLKDSIGPNMDVDSHDAVVWLGSMAFMLNPGDYVTNAELSAWAMSGKYQDVLYYDELKHLLAADDYFVSFKESNMNFPPTSLYAMDGNKDAATPVYPDRIFYKPSLADGNLSAYDYKSPYDFAVGNHRPVYLNFTLSYVAKNTITYEFFPLSTINRNIWPIHIERWLEDNYSFSSTPLPKWPTDNNKIRVYEVHHFTFGKNDLIGSIELPIVKSEYSGNIQQALNLTVDTTKLSTLGAGVYVLCYIIDGKLVSVSNIFKLFRL